MLLGIDYGLKNIGLAISDGEEKVATAYKTVNTQNIVQTISTILKSKNINKVIVGYPTKGNGEEGFVAKMMNSMLEDLKKNNNGLEIVLIDESMTTQIALQNLRNLGYSAKNIVSMKDSEAARIILQTYIDNLKV